MAQHMKSNTLEAPERPRKKRPESTMTINSQEYNLLHMIYMAGERFSRAKYLKQETKEAEAELQRAVEDYTEWTNEVEGH
jgi:hypothetical protein